MNANNTQIKLKDMGTTGLVNYVITGSRRMRGARLGQARKVIAARFCTWGACNAFVKAVNAALGFRA